MAWSAKIQIGDGGVANYNEWEVWYDVSLQPTYQTFLGMQVGQPEPQITWHTPDEGENKPVKAIQPNKVMTFTMDVRGDDFDTRVQSLAPLKRALNGADSQALRYEMTGEVEKVRVAITPDGATYTTYYDVIYGTVDDSGSYYSQFSTDRTHRVVFTLGVKPYGYGDSFTLRNDLPSSPHFIEDSNSDGLADGGNFFGTPSPTGTLGGSIYLIGGQAQRIICDASNDQGWESDVVTAGSGSDAVAYAWIVTTNSSGAAGGDAVTVVLKDGGGGTIDTETTPDKTFTGPNGLSWGRYVVSGNNAAVANFYVQVRRITASEITWIHIDGVYLQTGILTAPDAWCSTSSLENRYDPTNSNEERINYLDVWGMPGDLPAFVNYELDGSSISDNTPYLYFPRHEDGDGFNAAQLKHWWDDDEMVFGYTGGASPWSTIASAGRSNGQYEQVTGSAFTDNTYFEFSTSSLSEYKALQSRPHRIFAVVSTNNTGTFTIKKRLTGLDVFSTSTLTFEDLTLQANTNWQFVDLGLYTPSKYDLSAISDGSETFQYYIDTSSASGQFNIDFVMVLPVGEQAYYNSRASGFGAGSGSELNFDSANQQSFTNNGVFHPQSCGSIPHIMPGEVANRMLTVITNDPESSNDEHFLTDAWAFTLTITPRASHLLS